VAQHLGDQLGFAVIGFEMAELTVIGRARSTP
jgi:hypothetical protein